MNRTGPVSISRGALGCVFISKEGLVNGLSAKDAEKSIRLSSENLGAFAAILSGDLFRDSLTEVIGKGSISAQLPPAGGCVNARIETTAANPLWRVRNADEKIILARIAARDSSGQQEFQ